MNPIFFLGFSESNRTDGKFGDCLIYVVYFLSHILGQVVYRRHIILIVPFEHFKSCPDMQLVAKYFPSEHWSELEELIDELDLTPTTLRIADPI